jgi:hypothetical protein
MKTGLAMTLSRDHDLIAPDGSEVRVLLSLAAGNILRFPLGRSPARSVTGPSRR